MSFSQVSNDIDLGLYMPNLTHADLSWDGWLQNKITLPSSLIYCTVNYMLYGILDFSKCNSVKELFFTEYIYEPDMKYRNCGPQGILAESMFTPCESWYCLRKLSVEYYELKLVNIKEFPESITWLEIYGVYDEFDLNLPNNLQTLICKFKKLERIIKLSAIFKVLPPNLLELRLKCYEKWLLDEAFGKILPKSLKSLSIHDAQISRTSWHLNFANIPDRNYFRNDV
jgi:Leucine-rich repeat (LRR) protein